MSPRRPSLITAVVLGLVVITSAQQRPELSAQAVRAALEQGLVRIPHGFDRLTSPAQSGVRVLAVAVDRSARGGHRITIDLSQKALTFDTSGNADVLLDQLLMSLARVTTGETAFRFLVDGLPLERLIPAAATRLRPQDLDARGPVVISAGHGAYWNEDESRWLLQRDVYWDIVEDFVNWDIARNVLEELAASGMEARPARQPDQMAGAGVSGWPLWQEGAKYFLRSVGAPESVSEFGVNEYNRDINSRPFYANWIDASALVSIHNNGGWSSGTETWYDETNGWGDQSRRLAEMIQASVVRAIRDRYDPNWVDRGLRSCNACKGETRLATRPAVLVELAFMDMKAPDNDALHDETFKRLVARAIREALQTWAGSS